MSCQLKVQKVSDEKLAFKNCIFVHKSFLDEKKTKYLSLQVNGKKFPFYFESHLSVPAGYMAMTLFQRKWTNVTLDEAYNLSPIDIKKNIHVIKSILTVDFLQKSRTTQEMIDSEIFFSSFIKQFGDYPITVGQSFAFMFDQINLPFIVTVEDIEVGDISDMIKFTDVSVTKSQTGVLSPVSKLLFKKVEGSMVSLVGKAKESTISMSPLISPNWDFNQMGIGGLDKEFSAIFRRAFASRLFPPEVVLELGLKHVRGLLLFGPPGTGKTLMARQIGKMLNAREPKIVNGPEIFNKYVGESESNIRKLFEEAEIEQKKAGINSSLHIIIFDEIDAICKKRGSTEGGTGVSDTVVNQLLSKLDGIHQLNNILVIGMTNRKDLIDEALLRPGRFEVQMEINLPDEFGRGQILNIHMSQLKKFKKIDQSIDVQKLAHDTKNYSGAELEGLVRAATTTAMNRLVKVDKNVHLDPKAVENLKVTMEDFFYSLQNDIKPAFGASTDDLLLYVSNGIVHWCNCISLLIEDGKLMLEQTRNGGIISPVSVLFQGPVGAGKTTLAAQLALSSNFPLVKLCSADQMVAFSENAKCLHLKKIFDDAAKSELSCVVIDGIERILEYVPIGPRFSNSILQTLLVLLNKRLPNNHKLLVVATTSCPDVMNVMGVGAVFTRILNVPMVTSIDELKAVNEFYKFFSEDEFQAISILIGTKHILIALKKLLSLCEMAIQVGTQGYSSQKFFELLTDEKAVF